jgi:hypothetical protein
MPEGQRRHILNRTRREDLADGIGEFQCHWRSIAENTGIVIELREGQIAL